MNPVYVLGARQRELLFKNEQEQRLYESALIVRLDPDGGSADLCVEYQSPPEARAHELSSNIFKSGTLVGANLYTCTSTEILTFQVPSFKRSGYISLPCFNDLHHVTPTQDGNLLVANTGLDAVVKLTPEGGILEEWSVLREDLWARFSRDIDYRKVESTKPHRSHPNFVFEMNGNPWVTRFFQRDAVCLTSPEKRIEISVEKPHDGLLFGGRLFFTTVDGRIVIVSGDSLAVERVVDLNPIDNPSNALLGWCRGLLPVDERRIWVGFTRVRKTKFTENLLWVKHGFRSSEKPTHIALYDLAEQRCVQEIDLEPYGLNVVFGIYFASMRPAGS